MQLKVEAEQKAKNMSKVINALEEQQKAAIDAHYADLQKHRIDNAAQNQKIQILEKNILLEKGIAKNRLSNLKSKHDQANALHQEEINRIKANHENKIHELSRGNQTNKKENHAAEIDSLSMLQKSTIDNIEQSKLNEVAVLNKLHAESNEKIQIAEANQKKQICNAMILKWKAKNILYGFRTWKNYVVLCKLIP